MREYTHTRAGYTDITSSLKNGMNDRALVSILSGQYCPVLDYTLRVHPALSGNNPTRVYPGTLSGF